MQHCTTQQTDVDDVDDADDDYADDGDDDDDDDSCCIRRMMETKMRWLDTTLSHMEHYMHIFNKRKKNNQ